MDFEAVLCGCLLVKVKPQSYITYPNVFQPTKHVYGFAADMYDLEAMLLAAIQVRHDCIM